MTLEDVLGSPKGNVIQNIDSQSDTYTHYSYFYEPPYMFIFNGAMVLICLVFLLKGMFSFLNSTR
jgi:hypothetical protein